MQILYNKNNNCHNLYQVCKYNNFLLFKLLQQTTLILTLSLIETQGALNK